MNQEKFLSVWNSAKGELKQQWGELTDDEIMKIDGHSDKFIAKLQEKYGYTKDEAEKKVDEFVNKFHS